MTKSSHAPMLDDLAVVDAEHINLSQRTLAPVHRKTPCRKPFPTWVPIRVYQSAPGRSSVIVAWSLDPTTRSLRQAAGDQSKMCNLSGH